MNASDVARYLNEHPDFLVEHGELFCRLTVPHPHGGQAISLAERQLHALREKIRLLEGKLAELLRFGEENDEIGEKVHRMTLALLEAGDYGGLRVALFENLRDGFSVPHFALRLWSGIRRDGDDFCEVSEALRLFADELRHPYCGPPTNLEILEWFGEVGPHVRSVALIPLRRESQAFGLLALGSEESERFYPEMGTLYLSRIGDLVASSLRRQPG